MEINQTKQVKVNAKVLKIHIKVADQFCGTILDSDGEVLIEKEEGYVPNFMPGNHYGDYLILDIDLDSGQILNWKTPSTNDVQNFINGEED